MADMAIDVRPLLRNHDGMIYGPKAWMNTPRLAYIDTVLRYGSGESYSEPDTLGGCPLIDWREREYRTALENHEAALKPWDYRAYLIYEDDRLIAQTPDQEWRYWLPPCSGAYRLLPIDLDALVRDGYRGPTTCDLMPPDTAYWRPGSIHELHELWRARL